MNDVLNHPRRHHYVPRVLLNRFAVERKKGKFQTHVFDKSNSRSFLTAVENIAVESDFNTLERDGFRLCLEAGMGSVENMVAPHLSQIVEEGSIAALNTQGRAALCIFAALQFLRGKDFRVRFENMAGEMREKLREFLGDRPLPADLETQIEEDDLKTVAFRMILESLGEFSQMFAIKLLLLFKAAPEALFLIGDAPIALNNNRAFGPYGNIGLVVPGIQINLPISADYTLGFWCPSLEAEISEKVETARSTLRKTEGFALLARPDLAKRIVSERATLQEWMTGPQEVLNGMRTGSPIPCTVDHVTHFNSQQIRSAERWVMSKDGRFDIARRMIADDKQYRTGPRIKIN